MSNLEYRVSPRSVDVLPGKVTRRVTRRDGLLPLVFVLELLAGVAFGLAAHSGQSGVTTSVPARLTFAPVAQVTVLPAAAAVGPAVGPLRPGTVRPQVVEPAAPVLHRHAPRNPFGPQVPSAR